MTKMKQRISNPMTIIAIFAALSETSAAVSLPFLDNDEREIYIWFLISFPFYLLLLFFVTLNFNYRSLYAPSDFYKDKYFLKGIDNTERSARRKHPPPDSMNAATPLSERSRAAILLKARAFPYCFRKTRALPSAINLQTSRQVRHKVLLPGPLGNLCIVDARWMNTRADLTNLMDGLRKSNDKSGGVIVFMACGKSEQLLREHTSKSLKLAREANCAMFCIVYNLNSQEVKVLDQTR